MEDDETVATVSAATMSLHRNSLYSFTIDDDPVIATNCIYVDFHSDRIEAHIAEEETAYCIKKLIEGVRKSKVNVSLTLFSTKGKPSDTITFPAKIETFSSILSMENIKEITKWIVILTPL